MNQSNFNTFRFKEKRKQNKNSIFHQTDFEIYARNQTQKGKDFWKNV